MLRSLCFAFSALSVGCTCNQETSLSAQEVPEQDPLVVPTPASIGTYLSFDTASDGIQLTMAFYDRELGGLGYAIGMPNDDLTIDWTFERADGYPDPTNGLDSIDTGRYASQRTAPDGTVWAAHQEATGNLRVSHREGPNTWSSTRVEPGGNYASLDVGADGLPQVAHITENAEVKLTRFDGTSWSSLVLYTGEANGEIPAGVSHSRIFVDGPATYVAFRNDALQSLQVAEITAGPTVVVRDVDGRGDVGAWPSLGKVNGRIVTAYHHVGRQDLMVAIRDPDGTWRRQVVDDEELRGADSEVFEIDGSIAVLYFDGMNNDMMLARQVDTEWQIEAVGTDGALGYFNEVTFAAGHWWIGSFEQASQSLFVRAL